MNKNANRILIFTLIFSLILAFTNSIIDYIFYIILSSNYSMGDSLIVIQPIISFLVCFASGNILKYNVLCEINNRSKILIYLQNLIFISIIITFVNYIAYITGFNSMHESHIIFSTFIVLRNDWFGPIYFIFSEFLNSRNVIISRYIDIDALLATVYIIIGVLSGFNTKRIIRKDIKILKVLE